MDKAKIAIWFNCKSKHIKLESNLVNFQINRNYKSVINWKKLLRRNFISISWMHYWIDKAFKKKKQV